MICLNSAKSSKRKHLSGILQLCPPQGGAFAVTGQPGGRALSNGNFIFSILKDVHTSLFILNFLSAPNIEILNRVDKPCLRTGFAPPTPHGKFHLELGKGIVVLLLCSVPDRIDFAIVERLRKFNCSSHLQVGIFNSC